MPFVMPPLRVSRPIAACAPCRKAKSKCDQKLPVCTSCEKSNKSDQCISPMADARETSYVVTLEAQKAALDRRMAELRSRKNSLTSVPSSRRVSAADGKGASTAKASKLSTRNTAKREATDVDDLVGDFGLMSISATSRDFYGFTTDTSYAKFVLAASELAPLPMRSGSEEQLPDKAITGHLIDSYLTNTWKYLPIADETTIWTAFNNIYGLNQPTAFDHFVLRMVMAISLITSPSNDSRQAQYNAVSHLRKAMSYAAPILRPGSVGSMQALLFLVVYSMIHPIYFDWWMLLGSVSRAMVDIGMHHDPPHSANMSKPELDLRRRVFWCFYSLDRMAAMLLKHNFSIEEASVNVKMPPVAATPSAALAMFQLRRLQSQIFFALYESGEIPGGLERSEYVWQLYGQLGEWVKTATAGAADAAMARVLAIEYEFTCCFLTHPGPDQRVHDNQLRELRDRHSNKFFELVSAGSPTPLFVRAMGARTLWEVLDGT